MPKSFGNKYWLTPATKKLIAGDANVAEQLGRALKQLTRLHRTHPNLAQKFYSTTLENGDRLEVRAQWGREFVYLYRPGQEEEEELCSIFLETGRYNFQAITGETGYVPAILEFSDNITTDDYLGTMSINTSGVVVFRAPTTPQNLICGSIIYQYERWGVEVGSGSLVSGESIVLGCDPCGRVFDI